jgi:hypothetical protein
MGADVFPCNNNQSLLIRNEFRTCRCEIDENRAGRICVPASADVEDQYRCGLSGSVVTQGTQGKIVFYSMDSHGRIVVGFVVVQEPRGLIWS